jgi:hypothetical protein
VVLVGLVEQVLACGHDCGAVPGVSVCGAGLLLLGLSNQRNSRASTFKRAVRLGISALVFFGVPAVFYELTLRAPVLPLCKRDLPTCRHGLRRRASRWRIVESLFIHRRFGHVRLCRHG